MFCGAPVGSCLHGVPRANCNVVCRLPRGTLHGILHGDGHRRMATATWHVVWRMPGGMTHGMSQGDCHMACRRATATWHVAWHSIRRLPRGMTYGDCFMFQSRSCSAAVRSVLPGDHDRPKSEGRLQVGCNRPSTHACRRVMHAHNQPRSHSAAGPLLLREDTRWRSLS
jgi:hypothetical protein